MLIYRTRVLTGPRLGELASITVGQPHVDAPQPHAEPLAKDAKAEKPPLIPPRGDLVEDLRGRLAEKLEPLRSEAAEKGTPLPLNLLSGQPLTCPTPFPCPQSGRRAEGGRQMRLLASRRSVLALARIIPAPLQGPRVIWVRRFRIVLV